MNFYTGIGSRETPKDVIILFKNIGKILGKTQYTLRSGHAIGADQAFEEGCDMVNGKKEIYLPWENFEKSNSNLIVRDKKAFEIAENFHPYWYNLKPGAKKLQARNSHQILGKDLNTLTNFVICWTKDGKGTGGTGQAIRIANYYKIPVFDAGRFSDIKILIEELKNFIKNNKYNKTQ